MIQQIKQKIINWCLSTQEIEIGKFHELSSPNSVEIYNGDQLKFIEQSTISNWYVESENEYIKIDKSFKTVPFKVYTVLLEDEKYLECADEHIVIDKNNREIYVKDLKTTDYIKTIDGNRKVQTVLVSDQIENMYDLELKDKHVYYTNGILSHNTTVVAIYILWLTTFHRDKNCVIASKNMQHATEIMSRIKFSYEELPNWLKAGCKFYNRTSIEFDNGSKIKSEATTDKTGRGGSPSCVDGNTQITLRNKYTEEIITTSIIDTLNKVNLANENLYNNLDWEVLGEDNLFYDFDGILETPNQKTIKIDFSDKSYLICTNNHLIKMIDGNYLEAQYLLEGNKTYTNLLVKKIGLHSSSQTVYDLINVSINNSYLTNSIISHNCLFIDEVSFINSRIQDQIWASLAPSLSTGGKLIMTTTPNGDTDLFARLWRQAVSGTNNFKYVKSLYDRHPDRGPGSGYYEEMLGKLGELTCRVELDCEFLSADALLISSMRLNELRHSTPIYEDHGFKFWDEIKSGQIYFVAADIATGSGNDFSVVQVFDFPGLNQVAQYRTNTLIIPELYQKIKWILNRLTYGYHNEVFWTFERNSVGEAISSLHHVDENIPEAANLVSEGNNKYGMQTINKSKVLACMQLKTLVEKIKNGINIKSEIDIFELKNYISTGASYAAKSGATDDTVAALLLIVRLIKYTSEFDENAHKIMYQYDENDYLGDNQYEPLPVLF